MHKLILLLVFIPALAWADSKELCTYITPEGKFYQVNSLSQVPEIYRERARCIEAKEHKQGTKPVTQPARERERSLLQMLAGPDPKLKELTGTELASPDEVNLEGTVRSEKIVSSLGQIELRWPRKVELLFGRTPQRAMADAARTASRALKQAGFSPKLRNLSLDWKVVFMDEELPETQIPNYLVDNCHPAWMTPPANVYVVGQRVVAGCSGGRAPSSSVADSQLAQVLLHEIGHVVEYGLLGDQQMGGDRMRAEGFASWFEQYSSEYSAVIPKGSVKRYYVGLAREAIAQSPNIFMFSGTAQDYARASLFFHAVVRRRQVQGLMDLYSVMVERKLNLKEALETELHWSDKQLQEELMKVLSE